MKNKRNVSVGDFRLMKKEKKYILEVLEKGRISEGEKVLRFEKMWAKYINTKYVVSASSGTSALMMAWMILKHLDKLGGKRRYKVITSPLTYIATSNSIMLSRLEPVYVDIDPETFSITPENIKNHLKNVADPENYLAVNPVHLMGYVCDMNAINSIGKDYGLYVMEDSAQAHGSVRDGKKAGSFSLMSIFSFYIAHNIQVGEMGALNTSDQQIYKLAKKLKANGRMCDCKVCLRHKGKCPHITLNDSGEDNDPRFTHDLIGSNFKTMEFQAAIGISQLQRANWIFKKRLDNVQYLNSKLSKYESILQLPKFNENVSYLAYPIVIKDEKAIKRKKLRQELQTLGVETRPLFGCIPTQQPAYSFLKEKYKEKLPVAARIGRDGFYIGCHQYLSKKDLDLIVYAFEKALK